MTELDFITNIQDEITVSGQLPAMLEEREIQRIIKQQSNWAYLNYQYAVESQYFVIKKDNFSGPEFSAQRSLQLPDCVVSVYSLKEISGAGGMGNVNKDFSVDRLMASEMFLTSFTGDDLVMRTAQMSFFDLSKAFFLNTIAYDFNANTKKLRLIGHNPKTDVCLETYVKIPIDRLFDDYYFLRLCTAHAKLSYARLLGTYGLQLPGGVQIDFSSIRSEGEAEIDKIKEQIDSENVPDWFMIWHVLAWFILLPIAFL